MSNQLHKQTANHKHTTHNQQGESARTEIAVVVLVVAFVVTEVVVVKAEFLLLLGLAFGLGLLGLLHHVVLVVSPGPRFGFLPRFRAIRIAVFGVRFRRSAVWRACACATR